jgi:hypothetical protein
MEWFDPNPIVFQSVQDALNVDGILPCGTCVKGKHLATKGQGYTVTNYATNGQGGANADMSYVPPARSKGHEIAKFTVQALIAWSQMHDTQQANQQTSQQRPSSWDEFSQQKRGSWDDIRYNNGYNNRQDNNYNNVRNDGYDAGYTPDYSRKMLQDTIEASKKPIVFTPKRRSYPTFDSTPTPAYKPQPITQSQFQFRSKGILDQSPYRGKGLLDGY